ncbi:cobyrinic acid a,c-diamide synthase, partial [Rhizobium ruizarguesonis]
RADVRVAGVILNKVGSDRHEAMLRQALEAIRMPVIAVIGNDKGLSLPERHLGLVQAGEHATLDAFIDHAADAVSEECNFEFLLRIAKQGLNRPSAANIDRLPPLGARIAVARDVA